MASQQPAEYQDVRLAEVVRLGLANSDVLRDVGGTVVRSPETTHTQFDAAIVETDPLLGIEAGRSAPLMLSGRPVCFPKTTIAKSTTSFSVAARVPCSKTWGRFKRSCPSER